MNNMLKNVGVHCGSFGDGHYEASLQDDGGVEIKTVFDRAKQTPTVNLSRVEWDRLVAWVEWRRKDIST